MHQRGNQLVGVVHGLLKWPLPQGGLNLKIFNPNRSPLPDSLGIPWNHRLELFRNSSRNFSSTTPSNHTGTIPRNTGTNFSAIHPGILSENLLSFMILSMKSYCDCSEQLIVESMQGSKNLHRLLLKLYQGHLNNCFYRFDPFFLIKKIWKKEKQKLILSRKATKQKMVGKE